MPIRRTRIRTVIAVAALAAGTALTGLVAGSAVATSADSSWGTVAPAGDLTPSPTPTEPPAVAEGNDSSWGT